MPEDLFETRYDLTKKSKFREFYESNKILIYTFAIILVIIISSYNYYQHSVEKKKIFLSDNYIQAKVYIESGEKFKATEILKNVIYSDDPTYSTLSFITILNENLISKNDLISELFQHLLKNNKFDKEIRNLLIYKKALHESNHVEESKLLEEIRPLLKNEQSIWYAHSLLLLGDFYFAKKEFVKAKDFYMKILSIKNLQPDIYNRAKSKLVFIAND